MTHDRAEETVKRRRWTFGEQGIGLATKDDSGVLHLSLMGFLLSRSRTGGAFKLSFSLSTLSNCEFIILFLYF